LSNKMFSIVKSKIQLKNSESKSKTLNDEEYKKRLSVFIISQSQQ